MNPDPSPFAVGFVFLLGGCFCITLARLFVGKVATLMAMAVSLFMLGWALVLRR